MSIPYKRTEVYIARALADVPVEQRPAARLEIDLADVFCGPTSSSAAANLVANLFKSYSPDVIANTFTEVCDRYYQSKKSNKKENT